MLVRLAVSELIWRSCVSKLLRRFLGANWNEQAATPQGCQCGKTKHTCRVKHKYRTRPEIKAGEEALLQSNRDYNISVT